MCAGCDDTGCLAKYVKSWSVLVFMPGDKGAHRLHMLFMWVQLYLEVQSGQLDPIGGQLGQLVSGWVCLKGCLCCVGTLKRCLSGFELLRHNGRAEYD